MINARSPHPRSTIDALLSAQSSAVVAAGGVDAE